MTAKRVNKSAVSNGGKPIIDQSQPWSVNIEITGAADMLFHRWDCDAIEAKGNAAKNSIAKKTDNLETYLHRDAKGELCLPGEYLRQSVITAAKFRPDPRSPRKSAMDLFKAVIISNTELASLGTKDWDFDHRCRVRVQQAGVTRTRPGFRKGWKAAFNFMSIAPEYVDADLLMEVLTNAGRLVGVGDFRPTYGRFAVTKFDVVAA